MMGRTLGWISLVAGAVSALFPVKARFLGTDIACGPAVVALARHRQGNELCHTPALSWVLISVVLIVAGGVAVCWGRTLGRTPAREVFIWIVFTGVVLASLALTGWGLLT